MLRYINYDHVSIPLDNDWKNIGISLSGGADSAMLAYLICSNTSATIHISTQIRCWKTRPWQSHISEQVYKWFVNRFQNLTFVRHTNFIPPDLEWGKVGPNIIDEYGKLKAGNQIILRSFNEYLIHKESLDAWFAGVNMNPDVQIEGALEDRDKGHIDPVIEHMGVLIGHPFIHTRKNWIIKQYTTNNILDLLDITRSCEGDFEGLDYKTYKPGQPVPICGKCFWCQEKDWALRCE
jgi:hypothetical protein